MNAEDRYSWTIDFAMRELEAQPTAIDVAVFDLKKDEVTRNTYNFHFLTRSNNSLVVLQTIF